MGVGGREGRERDGEGLAQSESEDGSERHTHSEYHTASTTQRYAPHPTTTTHAATTTSSSSLPAARALSRTPPPR